MGYDGMQALRRERDASEIDDEATQEKVMAGPGRGQIYTKRGREGIGQQIKKAVEE